MSVRQKSQRGFVAVTLITLLAIALVLVVYAALLGTFPGGEVTVGGVGPAQIRYSSDNVEAGSWDPTLTVGSAGASWYARFEITGGTYSGPVTITWKLQLKTGAAPETWADVAGANETTSIVLSGSPEYIYATSDGAYAATNHNWGANVTAAGTYRVFVTVNSA